jgi:cytochrome c oxidase subunit 3
VTDTSELIKEPWSVLSRQQDASRVGMWIFLGNEILFFGALFLGYTFYRQQNPAAFLEAARETDIWFGTINTFILLTSSYTMAMASQVADLERGGRRLILACLAMTVALGILFLIVKGFEYKEDLDKLLLPGHSFRLQAPGASVFFAFYWTMTAVHAVHLSIGIVLVGRLIAIGWSDEVPLAGNPQLAVTALYWHLVDLVWIFLYPIFYLPGRSS